MDLVLKAVGTFPGAGKRGEDQAGEDGDDSDGAEEFDEGVGGWVLYAHG